MYYVTAEREKLMEFLPKGAVGAEIGVAQGDFASVILARGAPAKLALIDPWGPDEGGVHDRGEALGLALRERAHPAPKAPPKMENPLGDEKFRAIQDRFKGDARVAFHRQFSYRAAAAFPDKHFDFVYLDGDHRYEYVLQDLVDFAPKLKDDGLMMGHDFFEDAFAAEESYGVIGAVSAFLARTNFVFVALTHELFPTFVLAKRLEGFAGAFLRNLLDSDVFLIDLPASIAAGYRELPHQRPDGSKRRIPSFVRA